MLSPGVDWYPSISSRRQEPSAVKNSHVTFLSWVRRSEAVRNLKNLHRIFSSCLQVKAVTSKGKSGTSCWEELLVLRNDKRNQNILATRVIEIVLGLGHLPCRWPTPVQLPKLHRFLWAVSEVIPNHRVRVKPWAPQEVVQKQKEKRKKWKIMKQGCSSAGEHWLQVFRPGFNPQQCNN